MPQRANSRIRKLEILQFTLLASDLVWSGRAPYFAINSNRFGKPWEIKIDYSFGDVKDIRMRKEEAPSRKMFRQHLPEMLKERLLTRIITKNKRSKFYSITPLGIIHLVKSEMFYDGIKYPYPERSFALQILQTFAQQNVGPYKSMVFRNERFINSSTDLLKDISKAHFISLREQITHVFTNVNIFQESMQTQHELNFMEYFITNGYPDANRVRLASFDLTNPDYVEVTELNQLPSANKNKPSRDGSHTLKLDLEQFNHYLANLMICSLIYDSAMAHYDIIRFRKRSPLPHGKKELPHIMDEEIQDDLKDIPEYFLSILFLFGRHILRITKDQYELTTKFNENLSKLQFVKN